MSGVLAGPQLDVPQDITPAQLEILLNGLLVQEDGEKLPYSFHIQDMPLLGELGAHLQIHKVICCAGSFPDLKSCSSAVLST